MEINNNQMGQLGLINQSIINSSTWQLILIYQVGPN
jgi:hypothetical protein